MDAARRRVTTTIYEHAIGRWCRYSLCPFSETRECVSNRFNRSFELAKHDHLSVMHRDELYREPIWKNGKMTGRFARRERIYSREYREPSRHGISMRDRKATFLSAEDDEFLLEEGGRSLREENREWERCRVRVLGRWRAEGGPGRV